MSYIVRSKSPIGTFVEDQKCAECNTFILYNQEPYTCPACGFILCEACLRHSDCDLIMLIITELF